MGEAEGALLVDVPLGRQPAHRIHQRLDRITELHRGSRSARLASKATHWVASRVASRQRGVEIDEGTESVAQSPEEADGPAGNPDARESDAGGPVEELRVFLPGKEAAGRDEAARLRRRPFDEREVEGGEVTDVDGLEAGARDHHARLHHLLDASNRLGESRVVRADHAGRVDDRQRGALRLKLAEVLLGSRFGQRVGVAALHDRGGLVRDLEAGRIEERRRREMHDSLESVLERPVDQEPDRAKVVSGDLAGFGPGDGERHRSGGVDEPVALPERIDGRGTGRDLAYDQVFEHLRRVRPQLSRLLLVAHEELHGVPSAEQGANRVGADEAGSACDEDAHLDSPGRSFLPCEPATPLRVKGERRRSRDGWYEGSCPRTIPGLPCDCRRTAVGAPGGDMSISGSVAAAFWPVARAFERQVGSSGGGAAVCVYYEGRKVVDLWGGVRDEHGRPWREDTMSMSFSTSKGITSTLLNQLVDRGELDYDDSVARYWPEFAANGKSTISVRDLMTHRAGLSRIRPLIDRGERILDWEYMTDRLAGAEARPTTHSAYHALTYGWLTGELIQRITGQPLGDVIRDEARGAARPRRHVHRGAARSEGAGRTALRSAGRVPVRLDGSDLLGPDGVEPHPPGASLRFPPRLQAPARRARAARRRGSPLRRRADPRRAGARGERSLYGAFPGPTLCRDRGGGGPRGHASLLARRGPANEPCPGQDGRPRLADPDVLAARLSHRLHLQGASGPLSATSASGGRARGRIPPGVCPSR